MVDITASDNVNKYLLSSLERTCNFSSVMVAHIKSEDRSSYHDDIVYVAKKINIPIQTPMYKNCAANDNNELSDDDTDNLNKLNTAC